MARNETAKSPAQEAAELETPAEFTDDDTTAMATVQGSFEVGSYESAGGDDNLQLPRLKVAFGTSKWATEGGFPVGSMVINDSVLIAKMKEKVSVIILSVKEYWKQYVTPVDWDAGVKPAILLTYEDVVAYVKEHGGRLTWDNMTGQGPSFGKAMNMKMLLQQPEGVEDGMFGITIDGKKYTPVVWDIDKKSAASVGPKVNTAAKFTHRARGIHSGLFHLWTQMEVSKKNPGNSTPVPKMLPGPVFSDEVVAEVVASVTGQ